MSRCIVHIGMHKTGTTSIQASLHGYADDKFVYADLGEDSNHSLAMYSQFAPMPQRHLQHVTGGTSAGALSSYIARTRTLLEKAVASAGDRTLIISGEDISSIPAKGLIGLRDFFKARSRRLLIVAYVRPPAGLMTSGFQQRVKEGSMRSFDIAREYKSYEATFAKFDTVFGSERVRLWKFDPQRFPDNCVVKDFCTRLRIEFDKPVIRLNDSLPRPVVALLYIYRKMGTKLGFESMPANEGQKLGDLLAGIGNEKFRFSPAAIEPVLLKNRSDIQWMETRMGRRLNETLGTPEPGDIDEESDLLNPGPEAIHRLIDLLGKSAPRGIRGDTPEEIAQLVHAFRKMHGNWLRRFLVNLRA